MWELQHERAEQAGNVPGSQLCCTRAMCFPPGYSKAQAGVKLWTTDDDGTQLVTQNPRDSGLSCLLHHVHSWDWNTSSEDHFGTSCT